MTSLGSKFAHLYSWISGVAFGSSKRTWSYSFGLNSLDFGNSVLFVFDLIFGFLLFCCCSFQAHDHHLKQIWHLFFSMKFSHWNSFYYRLDYELSSWFLFILSSYLHHPNSLGYQVGLKRTSHFHWFLFYSHYHRMWITKQDLCLSQFFVWFGSELFLLCLGMVMSNSWPYSIDLGFSFSLIRLHETLSQSYYSCYFEKYWFWQPHSAIQP